MMESSGGIDSFSSLPDEILFHVISLLPFESAIQTMFLSKRWELVWNMSLVSHGTEEDAAEAVSMFLQNFNHRDPTRNTRRLKFHFGADNVLSAIIAPNNKLHLDFSSSKQELPQKFFWEIQLSPGDNLLHKPTHSTFFVKSLCLMSVNHLTRTAAVSSVISSFHHLEELKIIRCGGLESLKIESNTKLLSLTILECPQLRYLHIKSYKLQIFRYRGSLPWILPEYHFNLADAMLDSRHGPGYRSFKASEFDPVLLTIKNSRILTLCQWTFQALVYPCLSSIKADFMFYKLKELQWIDNAIEAPKVEAFISFLKLCPSLERLFVTIHPEAHTTGEIPTTLKQPAGFTRLRSLSSVRLEGFSKEEAILFTKCLDGIVSTSHPVTFVMASNGMKFWRLIKVPHEHNCKKNVALDLEVPKDTFSCQFQEVENVEDLCPKVAHMCV